MKTIGAFGGRPADLGGFRDHNPFRLFARERFRAFLRREGAAGEEEDVRILVAASLGPGLWFAEVAREEGRPYVLVTHGGDEDKWNPTQRAHAAALARDAETVTNTVFSPEEYISSQLRTVSPGSATQSWACGTPMAFVAAERDKVAGTVAREVHRLWDVGVPVFAVHPDEMTPPYLVMGALEEVRGAIPDRLLRIVEGAKLQLDCFIAQGMRPKPLDRARRRRQELAVLEATLHTLLHRGDGEG